MADIKHKSSNNSNTGNNSSLTEAKLSKSSNSKSSNSKSSDSDWSSLTRELIDTLPRVWTRGLLYFLMVFIGVVLPWAMFSQVDETGNARGRLEPQGKVFTVDSPVSGTITEVFVKEGQLVQKQQPLLELESEPVKSELKQVEIRLEGQNKELAQLKVLKNQLVLAVNSQKEQNKAQQLEKQIQINEARQSLQYSQTAKKLAQTRYNEAIKEVQRFSKAKEEGIVAEIQVVDKEDLAQERKGLLQQANSNIAQAKLRLEEQEENYQSLLYSNKITLIRSKEQQEELETKIETLESQIKENYNQIDALNYQLEQRIVKAPASGSIFQLSIPKPGEVVNPGDAIAEVAPKKSPLILKAQMNTTESGSLEKGMSVKLKFDAYPFQDYGVFEGKLINISPTTKVTNTQSGQIAAYDLDIELKQTYIQVQNKRIPLRPGQTATAEVIVRQRRLIDFVLEPFQKLHENGLEL
ncbi:MAG: HlyD family efflux transporter periplasmic adaptor subunit [Mastigocoleus sp. MO_167.B18]|nr:HlyD family efflux transporter periplasmic adaptor subunit [Mastigocoleus sp. MO_167.B18]